jgi:hypothetical protein
MLSFSICVRALDTPSMSLVNGTFRMAPSLSVSPSAKQRVEAVSDDNRPTIDGRAQAYRTQLAISASMKAGPVIPTMRCSGRTPERLALRAAHDLMPSVVLEATQRDGCPRLGFCLRRDHGVDTTFLGLTKDLRIRIAGVSR